MAYLITDYCTACGECLPACPNDAISLGTARFRINPYVCTECVGFAEAPECASVCPAEAIVPLVRTPKYSGEILTRPGTIQ